MTKWRAAFEPDRIFFVTALTLGTLFALFTPPFAVPDETGHWIHAVGVARDVRAWLPIARVSVPESAVSLIDAYAPGGDPSRIVARPRHDVAESSRVVDVQLHNVSAYGAIGYLPAASGLLVARALGLSTPRAFWLGRLSSMLICGLIAYWAVRVAGRARAFLAFVALMPMAVALRSSYSPDALLCSAALLLAAIVVGKPTPTRALLAFGSAWAMVAIKPSYLPLALLATYVVWSALPPMRLRIVATALSVILLAATAVFLLREARIAATQTTFRLDAPVSPDAQLRHIASAPAEVLAVVFGDLKTNWWQYWREAIGRLGWLDVGLPDAVYWLVALAMLLFAFDRAEASNGWLRWSVLALMLSTVMLVAFSVYVVWARLAAPTLEGFQGRYFLPIVPFAIAVTPGTGRWRIAWHVELATALAAIVLIIALRAVVGHYALSS